MSMRRLADHLTFYMRLDSDNLDHYTLREMADLMMVALETMVMVLSVFMEVIKVLIAVWKSLGLLGKVMAYALVLPGQALVRWAGAWLWSRLAWLAMG